MQRRTIRRPSPDPFCLAGSSVAGEVGQRPLAGLQLLGRVFGTPSSWLGAFSEVPGVFSRPVGLPDRRRPRARIVTDDSRGAGAGGGEGDAGLVPRPVNTGSEPRKCRHEPRRSVACAGNSTAHDAGRGQVMGCRASRRCSTLDRCTTARAWWSSRRVIIASGPA